MGGYSIAAVTLLFMDQIQNNGFKDFISFFFIWKIVLDTKSLYIFSAFVKGLEIFVTAESRVPDYKL